MTEQSVNTLEIGITTFLASTNPVTGERISHDERVRRAVEEMVLADQVGLDVYGIGEHHRTEFAASAPAVILAAAATQTKHIRLTSAVTVLSSDDPVRVYQQFATLDGLSKGRAEIMAGRGSFIESFPLFGHSLDDYEQLYEEKLDLLLAIRETEKVNWKGSRLRAGIHDLGVYPRSVQELLPVWIATGGNPESSVRAGLLGLPIIYAIIGGRPERFSSMIKIYKQAAKQVGHDINSLQVATQSIGFVSDKPQKARDLLFPSAQAMRNKIGRERGWAQQYTREMFDEECNLNGCLYVGEPEYVAEKILFLRKNLGVTRFLLHIDNGSISHRDILRAIELLGTKVAPIVRKEISPK